MLQSQVMRLSMKSKRFPFECSFYVLAILIMLIMGCSKGDNPISGPLKNTSSSSGTPQHPVLSKVLDITLDSEPALGIGYFYDKVKPSTNHTFKASFTRSLNWRWKSDDASLVGELEGISEQSQIDFVAPSDEKEISIWLYLSINGEDETAMRWRINVASNPVYLEFIHPDYEGTVKYGDPVEGMQAEVVEREIVVTFKPDIDRNSALRTIFDMECTVLTEVYDTNIYRVYCFDDDVNMFEKMQDFKGLDSVENAQPNFIYKANITPNDTYWDNKWDLRKIEGPSAWDVTQGSDQHVIAIIDTGIDRDHPDLQAKVLDGQDFITGGDGHGGETPGDGQDNNYDGYPDQNVGHGTHCAGIAAAISNNGTGSTGVTWNTKLIPLRIFPTDGDSGADEVSIMGAFNWLKNNAQSVKIIAANMSFGAFYAYSTQEQSVITECYNRGVIMVAACGNSDYDADQFYPSAYNNVMAVAATNSNDIRASFSNYGLTVDVCAPGVLITSTYFDNTYAEASGTSMASPEVTGLVGLVKAKWTAYTQDEVVDQIKYTADDIYDLNPGYSGLLGTGRINAYRAVTQGLTPNLEFNKLTIDEDKYGPTDGNRDRLVNPGERVELYLNVFNAGLSSATDVTATIEVTNPLVHVIKNSSHAALLTRGERTDFDTPFFLFIDRSIADGTEIALSFNTDDADGNGPWEFDSTLTVYKNKLVNENLNVSGEDIGSTSLTRNTADIPLLRVDFEAQSNYVIVDSIRLTRLGTAPEGTEDEVKIYLDADGNGEYDGKNYETQIGISSYLNPSFYGDFDRLGNPHNNPEDDPIDFNFGIHQFDATGHVLFEDLIIPATNTRSASIFIVVDIASDAQIGSTFGFGIAAAQDIIVSDGDNVTGTFPINANPRKIRPTWATEKQLTFNQTPYTWRAQAAVDNDGNLHVVWDEDKNDPDTDFDIGYRRSTSRGDTWSPEQLIVSNSDKSFFPDIEVTENDTIHVMYYSTPSSENNREIYYIRSYNNGQSWDTPRKITEAAGESRMPRMDADGDVLHVAFHSNRDGSYDIYYMQSTDDGDTFSNPVQVNNSNRESEEVDVTAKNGEVHLCWQDALKNSWGYITSANAFYAYSSDYGSSFETPIEISDSLGSNYNYAVRLDVDESGLCRAAFHSDKSGSFDVWMCEGSDGNMSAPQRITWFESGSGWPQINVDQDGAWDICFDDTPPDAPTNIYHMFMESGMSTWSTPVRISANTSGDAQIPSMVKDSNLNIFCFWQDNRNETMREEIWYNRLLY